MVHEITLDEMVKALNIDLHVAKSESYCNGSTEKKSISFNPSNLKYTVKHNNKINKYSDPLIAIKMYNKI